MALKTTFICKKESTNFSSWVLVLRLNYSDFSHFVSTTLVPLLADRTHRKKCMVLFVFVVPLLSWSFLIVFVGGGEGGILSGRPTGCCYVTTFLQWAMAKKGSSRVHSQWAPAEEEALHRQEVATPSSSAGAYWQYAEIRNPKMTQHKW